VLGVPGSKLVRDAGRQMLATYQGEPEPSPRDDAS